VSAIGTLVWKEAHVLRRDQRFVLFLFAFPSVFALLLSQPLSRLPGVDQGVTQAIPGFTVMFTYYVVVLLGISHFREHAWGAWTLTRVSGLSRPTLILGIAAPYYLLGVLQVWIMLGLGWVFLGLPMRGSLAGLVLLILALQTTTVGLAFVLMNLTSSLSTMLQTSQLLALSLGAVSGAIMPISTMPAWARVVARVTPQYWALEGIKGVLEGSRLVAVLPHVCVLVGMGAALLTLGAWGFDVRKARRVPLR
jgi:ABC-2 type transport system permease protein